MLYSGLVLYVSAANIQLASVTDSVFTLSSLNKLKSPTCVYLYIIVSDTLFLHSDNVDHSHFVHITN